MSKFSAVVVPADPEQPAYWHEFDGFTTIQAKVGGSFDVFGTTILNEIVSVYVDDEGLYKYTTTNAVASAMRGYRIVGDAVIGGDTDNDGEQLTLPTLLGDYIINSRVQVTV